MSTSMVHLRMEVKQASTKALAAMGLSVSDAVRLLLTRIAAEQALPFEVRVPNAKTRAAMRELKAGRGKKVGAVKDLMTELNSD